MTVTDQEDVGEQGAQVDGSVQIVDQLRADHGLPQHHFNAASESLGISV
jgi:hypothetical protein